MARQPIQQEYTTFIKGLITEASPFTYPENASLEDENFILNIDGSRQRRFGIDYEDGYSLIHTGVDVTATQSAISSYTWTTVANNQGLDFSIVQVGNSLYFFKSSEASVSGNRVNGGNVVTIPGNVTNPMSFTSIYGFLVVVHGTETVYVLSYNIGSDTITVTNKRIQVRDLFGVNDGLATDARPTTLSGEHQYNLRNQGWPLSIKTTNSGLTTTFDSNPIAQTFTEMGWYPSNSDIVWAAKVGSAKEAIAINSFYPPELTKTVFGSTSAPKGKYVIDIFTRGANRGLPGLADISYGGVVSVATYAGRVFYAVKETSRYQVDNNSPHIGTMIFYSIVGDNISTLTNCYSDADPSAEHMSDPLATDGGFVSIPEAGEVIKLITMGNSLFVFCSNGVWEIHGGEEAFSATNQNITKVTEIGAVSPRTIVYAEDKIAYWGNAGIYLIVRNDLTLRGGNNDLSFATIQRFYDKIDNLAKSSATGVYDPFMRTIRWIYWDKVVPNNSFYNKELIYDLKLNAFYTFNMDSPSDIYPFVAGHVELSGTLSVYTPVPIVIGSNPVTINSNPSVVMVGTSVSGATKSSLKYVTIIKTGTDHSITFSYFKNVSFRDWFTFDGVGIDAKAKFLTGYITGGIPTIPKTLDYVNVYMKRTESGVDAAGNTLNPSSCKMQVQWNWTNSSNAGKWSREVEVYRLPRNYLIDVYTDDFNYGFTTMVSKNKVRGSGSAISFLFSTTPYNDCLMYGWGIQGSAGGGDGNMG